MLLSPEAHQSEFGDFMVNLRLAGDNTDKFREEVTTRMKAENTVYAYGISDFQEEVSEEEETPGDKRGKALVTDLKAIAADMQGEFSRSGKVAIIPLIGSMSRMSSWTYWGGYTRGTAQIAADIRSANLDPDITGIVLLVRSPGGDVDGTYQLSEAVRTSAKPVVAVILGLCCSGAMWAVAHAHKIYSTSPQDYIGSIGVYTIHGDYSKMLEDYGIRYTIITAEGSTEKVIGDPYNPLDPDHKAKMRGKITEVRTDFIATVKKGRGDKISDANNADNPLWTGAVFHTKEAKRLGLIDGMTTMEKAVLEAHRVGRKALRESSNYSPNKEQSMSIFKAYLDQQEGIKATQPQTLSVEEANALKGVLDANAAKLDEQGEKITLLSTQVTDLTGQVEILTNEKANLETKVTALTAENAELKTKIEKIGDTDAESLAKENAELKLKISGVEAVEAVEADPDKGVEAVEAVEAVEGLEAKATRLGVELKASQEKSETATKQAEENATKLKAAVTKYNELVAKYNVEVDPSKKAAKLDAEGLEQADNSPGQSGGRISMEEYERLSK